MRGSNGRTQKKSPAKATAKTGRTKAVSGGGPGRNPVDPRTLETKLVEYLNLAQNKGTDAYPLSQKKIASYIGCSHTLLSPKRIGEAPAEFQPVWWEFVDMIKDAQTRATQSRGSFVDRLENRVESLRKEVERLEKERESLWTWMLYIEAGLQDSGVNVEVFVPDDLRYLRKQRLEELPFE